MSSRIESGYALGSRLHGYRDEFACTGSRGFTLIELVIVIVIAGIIAATLTVFLRPVVTSYYDSRRRAELTDSADTALRRMARDVRMAVPNSIRSPNDQCFELLPTITGGRYRMAPNTVHDAMNCANSDDCSAPLDTSQPSTRIDALSAMSPVPSPGDWLVIGNQDANQVYASVSPTRAAITSVGVPNAAFGRHRIEFDSTQFPVGYNGGRFSVVANNGNSPAVFYVCAGASGLDAEGNGTGTLFRLTRGLVAEYPSACPATAGAAVLATNVSSCSFTYNPGAGSTQQRGFVSMLVEMARASETVSLSFGVHVDNVP